MERKKEVVASDIPSNKPQCFRCSEQDRKAFKQAAEREGLALGTWIKRVLRQAVGGQSHSGVKKAPPRHSSKAGLSEPGG